MSHLVIYDCDNTMGLPRQEIDDGLTLMYLLGRPDITLLGVTTTFGNGAIDRVYAQTEWLLHRLGHPDIPLYRGQGQRGEAPTPAAHFLAQSAAAHPGEITLLATGPLGNLHAAAQLDTNFLQNLGQIVCMGGYLHGLHIGWRDVAELNLSANPEASWAVLRAPCPVTLMNAHVCLQAAFGWRQLRAIRSWPRDLRRMVWGWLLAFGLYCGVPAFYLWDLLPAVYISFPDLFDHHPVCLRSTVDDLTDGTLVVSDEQHCPLVNMPARILNKRRFYAHLSDAWTRVVCKLHV